VVCAPVYTQHDGLASQLSIGIEEGMKHESSIHCDELVSLPKSALTNFVGTLQSLQVLRPIGYTVFTGALCSSA
jgi:mRNA-degrading endonuclease toxin of MazEF toxin-antitoxin module